MNASWPKTLTAILATLAFLSPCPVYSAEIWNGPSISFTNNNNPADVDMITPSVGITRGNFAGLYNSVFESSYHHSLSPVNTEWAFGQLTNYAALTYSDWEDWFGGSGGGGPPSTLGRDAVMHIVSEDIYLSIRFTAWGVRTGGFTYTRSTAPTVPEPSSSLIFAGGFALLATRIFRRR
jgi:hypothetical protein